MVKIKAILNYACPPAYVCIGLIFILVICLPKWARSQAGRPFDNIKQNLIQDGFCAATIRSVFDHPGIYFDPKGIAFFFVYREAHLNYDQFAAPRYIRKARQYMQTHAGLLTRAEKIFGVDGHVITAIILVETKLGTYTGGSSVLNTLSSLAALAQPSARDGLWSEISKKKKISRKKFEKKADRKSKWAYAELKAFLRYTLGEGMDPVAVKGSIAGALGIAQFMPSNILAYGRDGNADGRIDLFGHADAIASVANYLKRYGWRPGISRKKAYKIIWKYNHSKYYVEAVLKITELLKERG